MHNINNIQIEVYCTHVTDNNIYFKFSIYGVKYYMYTWIILYDDDLDIESLCCFKVKLMIIAIGMLLLIQLIYTTNYQENNKLL